MFSMLFTLGIISIGLMIVDKINLLLGATIWSLISYIVVKSLLKTFLGLSLLHEKQSLCKPLIIKSPRASWVPSKVYDIFEKYFPIGLLNKNIFGKKECFKDIVVESFAKLHCGKEPSHADEIKTFVQKISQEYIQIWYKEVSDHPEFLKEIDFLLEDILTNVCHTISKIDKTDFVHKSLLLYSNHFKNYLEALETAHQDIGIKIKSETMGKIPTLKSAYKSDHPALQNEWKYVKNIAATALELLGPVDMLDSPLPRELLEDIIAHNILLPVFSLLSSPAWLNHILIALFSSLSKTPRSTQSTAIILTQATRENTPEEEANKCQTVPPGLLSPTLSIPEYPQDNSSVEATTPLELDKLIERNISLAASPAGTPSTDWNESENSSSQLQLATISHPPSMHFSSCMSDFPPGKTQNPLAKAKTLSSTPRHENKYAAKTLIELKRSRSMDYISQKSQRNLMSNFMSHAIGHKPDDVEEAEEAIEYPPLFSNILIVSTETATNTKEPYTLYCIQYDGLFTTTGDVAELVTKTILVKRRFREFLTLHSRLEDNPNLKKHLKSIKGPSKWLHRPGSSTDQKNVQERRVFLQHYLRQVCTNRILASSNELQEFLAYGSDASLAYVRPRDTRGHKPLTRLVDLPSSVPRIDKMLVKGVMGAFDRIKTVLPSLPPDPILDMVNPDKLMQGVRRRSEPPNVAFDKECKLQSQIVDYLSNFTFNWSVESVDSLGPSKLEKSAVLPFSSQESHISSRMLQIHQDIPLGSTVIDIAFQVLPYKDLHFVIMVKLLAGKYIDRLLEESLAKALTYSSCVEYLHRLHLALWPEEHKAPPSEDESSLDHSRVQALNLLQSSFPDFVKKWLGPKLETPCLYLLDSIQYPHLNKCLVYQLADLLVETVLTVENRL